jgi:iron complex transport system ATP-binding protein
MELKVEHLHVALSKKEIVKNISLHVQNKQFVGLIGPNGSGKSTLLQAIYQLHKPKSGTMSLNNQDIGALSAKNLAQIMSVVAQFNTTSFDFTVAQMVLFGRTPHHKFLEGTSQKDEQIVRDSLEKVGMSDYAAQSFLSLSGGEQQRVILARAIAQQPQFIVLDEPTNHLDISYQISLMKMIKELDISVLTAIHDLELAAQYCDYLYALKDGKVVAQGKPKEVLTKQTIEELFGVVVEIYEKPFSGHLGIEYF